MRKAVTVIGVISVVLLGSGLALESSPFLVETLYGS